MACLADPEGNEFDIDVLMPAREAPDKGPKSSGMCGDAAPLRESVLAFANVSQSWPSSNRERDADPVWDLGRVSKVVGP